MNKDWIMSDDGFDDLLEWLASDREQAAIKYEQIRARLIKFFSRSGHSAAEDLADETFNRVASRLSEIRHQVYGDPSAYFYGVARKVQLEYLRRKQPSALPESMNDSERVEIEHRCLEECMAKLSDANRA